MRYVRSFLLALTTLAFFLLVLVAGLYVFITPERVSARLANTLSHHLGLKIEMAKLHIDTRLPSLKFTVKDAVLTSADGAVRGSVPSATIRLHPLALFTRSPRISEITTADGSLTFGNTSPEDVRAWIEGTVSQAACLQRRPPRRSQGRRLLLRSPDGTRTLGIRQQRLRLDQQPERSGCRLQPQRRHQASRNARQRRTPRHHRLVPRPS